MGTEIEGIIKIFYEHNSKKLKIKNKKIDFSNYYYNSL